MVFFKTKKKKLPKTKMSIELFHSETVEKKTPKNSTTQVMAPLAPDGTGVGNTSSTPVSKGKVWCFTVNNPPGTFDTDFKDKEGEWIYQWEEGENKTIHIQGFIRFKNARHFNAVKTLIGHNAHIEKCRHVQASIEYCQKQDTRIKGPFSKGIAIIRPLRSPLENKELRPFQRVICNMIDQEPDDRSIVWICDPEGKGGKTTLAKHLCINHPHETLFVQGKTNDIKHAMVDFIKKHGSVKTCIFGFPRTYEEFVSYDAIESIKDGIFFSGKYESSMVMYNPPHVFIFANFLPDTTKLSQDRWVIYTLEHDHSLKKNNVL